MRSTAIRLCVGLNVLAGAFLATAFAATSRLLSSSDEAAHVDYAYQVWHGRLPVFEHGLLISPGFGKVPPVQWVAQHPPLFYVLQAPVVGPFIDHGRYQSAVVAGRAVNVLIAAALVAAVMWAGSKIVPRRPDVWLLAGTIAAINPWVIRVGGSVYNDNFAALWSTLLLGCTAWMARSGPTRGRLALFGLVATAAFGSRIQLAVLIAACALVLALAWLWDRPPRWRALVGLAAGCAAAGSAWAWFYVRNWRLSGSVTGGHPEYWAHSLKHVHRQLGPLRAAVDVDQWLSLFHVFGWDASDSLAAVLLWLVPVAAACMAAARLRRSLTRQDAVVAAVLAAIAASILLVQFWYAAGSGSPNPRYLLPLVAPTSIGIAWFLSLGLRGWHLVTAGWLAVALGGFPWWMRHMLALKGASVEGAEPVAWVSVVLGALAVGAAAAIARRAARRPVPPDRAVLREPV